MLCVKRKLDLRANLAARSLTICQDFAPGSLPIMDCCPMSFESFESFEGLTRARLYRRIYTSLVEGFLSCL